MATLTFIVQMLELMMTDEKLKLYEYTMKQQQRYEINTSAHLVIGRFMLILFVSLFVGSVYKLITGGAL